MSDKVALTYPNDIRRTLRTYKTLGDPAVAQVAAHDLHVLLDADANSIAIIVKHLAGNLMSRFTDFLTTDGEKPYRDRDGEFEMTTHVSRDEMLRWWDSSWAVTLKTLEELTPA